MFGQKLFLVLEYEGMKQVLQYFADKLTAEFGKGFSMQNLRKMRQFYRAFPIRSTVSSELSWSHYRLLMRVTNETERAFRHDGIEMRNARWN